MPNFQRGFDSQYEEISVDDVPVQGKIPDWLEGTIVRNGSGQYELNHAESNQCFDPHKRVCYVH